MIAIQGGTIVTMAGERIHDGVILVEDKKIKAVGKDIAIPEGAQVIDASDKWVTPGLIDAHTHLSTFNEPQVINGRTDANEMSGPMQAHLRGIDALNPFDYGIPYARAAGFTTCYTGPGSGNVICGTGISFKLHGKTVEDMVIPGSEQMKMALGENPKTAYGGKGQTPMTRMGTAGVLRETLANAKVYSEQLLEAEAKGGEGKPKFDFKMEALVKVVRGEMKCRIHCHRNDDIVTAIRVAEEFGLDYSLEHATEGWMIADYLGRKKATCVVGPLTTGPSKMEIWNRILETPAILDKAGVTVCLTADAGSETQWLPMHIGLCIARGLSEETAFKAVTVNAAALLGLSDRIGSIEAGKDADLAIFNGFPFSNMTRCVMTMIDGEIFES